MCEMIVESFESNPEMKEKIRRVVSDPKDRTKVIVDKVVLSEEKGMTAGFTILNMEIDTRGRCFKGIVLLATPNRGYYHVVFSFPQEGLVTDLFEAQGGVSERQIWSKNGAVTFEDSFPVLKSWLEECESSKHALCNHGPQPLPTRLLHVIGDSVRLVVPGMQTGRYAALSHCWGSSGANQGILRTTRNTLAQHLESISLDQLPESFKDAVNITQKLGLHYLWIDSLCIIQGDDEDWRFESSKMADVFGNAHVTIAATAASDSHEGCLFTRKPAKHVVGRLWGPDETIYHARMPSGELTSLYSSPLYKRGWVLQEIILSKRVVHFARDQLFWHCRSTMKSEDGFVNQNLGSTFLDLDSAESARRSWWSWAEDYSRRKVTNASDKYPALAGLTTAFRETTKLTPKAGLWEEDIHFGLLWCSQTTNIDGSDIPASANPAGPSWSWLSINRPIRALTPRNSPRWKDHDEKTTKAASITAVTVVWSDRELVSSVLAGRIEMHARLKPIHVCPRLTAPQAPSVEQNPYPQPNNAYLLYWKWPGESRQPPQIPWIGEGTFDADEGPASGSSVLCLEISIYGPCSGPASGVGACREYNHCRRDVLLVRATAGGQGNEYERIGAGSTLVHLGSNRHMHPQEDYFYDAVPQDIILV